MDPVTTSPGGSGAAPATPAPAAVFGNIRTPLPQINLGGAAPQATTSNEGTDGNGADPTKAKPPVEGQEPNAQPQTPKLLAGRYKTPEELETAHTDIVRRYESSSREGQRLFQEYERSKQELARLQAELTEVRKKAQPAFQELGEEELNKLATENPAKFHRYLEERAEWKRQQLEAKAAEERKATEIQQHREAIMKAFQDRRSEMRAKPEQFPHFEELYPVMEDVADAFPMLNGYRESMDLLYLVSLGLSSHQQLLAARTAAGADRDAAARAANNGAAHVQPSPAGTGGAPKADGLDDFNRRLVNAGPKPVFKNA